MMDESNDMIKEPFNPNDIDIDIPPFSVGFLIDSIKNGDIKMNTKFPRKENLWSKEKQSRLIESLLMGLPLPAFYFDATNEQWDIIDGLQRCWAIFNFCIEKDEERKLKLTGLEFLSKRNGEPYLEGLSFDELPLPLQTSIKRRPITVYKIKKAPQNVRNVLYKRLNISKIKSNDDHKIESSEF